jgi:plasmid stability protein
MISLAITGLDDALVERLRESAASHGRSAEDEARAILESALESDHMSSASTTTGADLWREIRERIDAVGGVELELPPRGPGREPPISRTAA